MSHLHRSKIKCAFVSRKVVYEKPLSKLSCVCLPLEKLVNGKHFPVKEKFGLVFRKVFSFYFERKTLSGSCEKIKNIILFVVDYIKFSSQTFDCYIYIYIYIYIYFFFFFEYLFFNFISYNLIFILTLVLIFIIVICFSLIIF